MHKFRTFLLALLATMALLAPVALMPTGEGVKVTATVDQPIATPVTTPPLSAEARPNKAQSVHFKCADDRFARNGIDMYNATPTANVSSIITFDNRTGSYEVITVDPRITIGHTTVRTERRSSGESFTDDVYNWSLRDGVELYGVFIKHVDDNGIVSWGRANPKLRDGVYRFSGWREYADKTPSFVIVATDTTTCAKGNELLDGMWKDVNSNLLF